MKKQLLNFFYRFKFVRTFGRKILKARTINQPFYNGVICFNAVEFSFFWVNNASCESRDKETQDMLLQFSLEKDYFIDIGSNIGIMTLSIALRNPKIRVLAYDPNKEILSYLKKSVSKNKLGNRVTLVNAAVSDKAGKAHLNFTTGSYSGHLSEEGIAVDMIDFGALLKEYANKKTLFKMDIEGFEKNLVPILAKDKNPLHHFVIEIHPKGLNGISDPEFVLQQLFENDFTVTDAYGKKVNAKSDITDWDNIACHYEK